jgi:hypothetical protein
MELKVEGNRFYVLEVGGERWVHDTVESAVRALKERTRAEDDLNLDNIRMLEVSILKRKWKIQDVSWVKIALDLIEGKTAVKGKSN